MNAKLLYPPYYKDVIITYIDSEGAIRSDIAWLAVNDRLEYIWTIVKNDIVISDDNVDSWREK